MIYLQIFNNYFLKIILFLFILISIKYYNLAFALENTIIFKLNNQAYTSYDYENRKKYIEFVSNDTNLNKEIILNDFISARIFYEYYLKNINNDYLENKSLEVFNNIRNQNKEYNKFLNNKNEEINIIENLKLDLSRKFILEKILNERKNDIAISNQEIDLVYKFKLKYINIETKNINNTLKNLEDIKNKDYESIKEYLLRKNINFFEKEKEINNISNINYKIKSNILSDNNSFFFENNDKLTYVQVIKSFTTFEGLIANIYSLRTNQDIDNSLLNCENLKKIENANITNKEYEFKKLNSNLKKNLIDIDDYVKLSDNNETIYLFLCNLKFDLNLLNNFNYNKIVSTMAGEIEKKFISKYSRNYNLERIDE